ncbi:hypothetical protein [Sphingomonas sp.]|uniref:hypothetical protein n=1 Tax=Sphingomonas sp. TaxID=28214 RepID=UPI001EB684A2|nr:hypothetical protein [Sphingomonas sp.]MBX3594263.1 hypothetical protein [Sphingomonas sp.]
MKSITKRRIIVGGGAAALALLALPHPSADIRIITHDVSDSAPHKFQAAIDFGILAVSVLYTWSQKQANR